MALDWLEGIGRGMMSAGNSMKDAAEQKQRSKERAMDDYDRTGRWDENILGPAPTDKATPQSVRVPMLDAFGGLSDKPGIEVKQDFFKPFASPDGQKLVRDVRRTPEWQADRDKRLAGKELIGAKHALFDDRSLDARDKREITDAAGDAGDVRQMMVQRMGAQRSREEEAIRNARELEERKAQEARNHERWLLEQAQRERAARDARAEAAASRAAILASSRPDRDARDEALRVKHAETMAKTAFSVVGGDLQAPGSTGDPVKRAIDRAYMHAMRMNPGLSAEMQSLLHDKIAAEAKNRIAKSDVSAARTGFPGLVVPGGVPEGTWDTNKVFSDDNDL